MPASTEFLAGLRERADRHGILLVVDEVQTGWGRTGRFWGGEHFDAQADILVTAKGLASGFPLSGIAASGALMEKAWPGSQGGTYGANAVACAAAIATLDVIQDEKLVENAAARGAQLKDALSAVADRFPQITDVRGLGLMIGNEFRDAEGNPTAQRGRRGAAGGGQAWTPAADLRRLGPGRPVHPSARRGRAGRRGGRAASGRTSVGSRPRVRSKRGSPVGSPAGSGRVRPWPVAPVPRGPRACPARGCRGSSSPWSRPS